MKVARPIPINDGTFSNSSIPEPDTLRGEVEFVPNRFEGYLFDRKSSPSDTYAIDASIYQNYIYVVEGFGRNESGLGGGYVHRYNIDGSYSGLSFTTSNFTTGIEVDNGKIFTITIGGFVQERNLSGTVITTHDIQTDVTSPVAICSNNAGGYNILDFATGEIVGFDSAFIANSFKLKVGEPGLQFYGLTNRNGNMYYIDQSVREVVGITTENNVIERFNIVQTTDEYASLGSIFFDPTSGMYVLSGEDNRFYKYIDGVYSAYYAPEDRVIKVSMHKVYQCAISTDEDPEDGIKRVPPTWVEVGATNRWAMFDYKRTTQSIDNTSLDVELTFDSTVDAVSIFNFDNVDTIRIIATSQSSGQVYNKLHITDGLAELVDFDIPPFNDLVIEIKFLGADIAIGEVVVGLSRDLGVLVAGVVSDRIDYSRLVYDDFGEVEYVERPIVKYTTYPVVIPKGEAPGIERYLDSLKGTQSVWVGDTGNGDLIITYGRIERSPMTYNNQSIVEYQIKVRGSI